MEHLPSESGHDIKVQLSIISVDDWLHGRVCRGDVYISSGQGQQTPINIRRLFFVSWIYTKLGEGNAFCKYNIMLDLKQIL